MPSPIRAAATYAEVEEALRGFLARHPEVSKDTSVMPGSKADSALSGAIASMAYEGAGSLFDTMNYGTGNPAADRAVVRDLTDTLAALGLYYEQGHDWSLGVFPADESVDEKDSRAMLEAVESAAGADPGSAEMVSSEDHEGFLVATVRVGGRDFLVGRPGALGAMAEARVADQIAEDEAAARKGNEPSMSIDLYLGYADRQAAREAAEAVAEELADGEADDLSDSEKISWLESRGLLAEGSDEAWDSVWDANLHSWVEERAAAAVGSDPFQYMAEVSGDDLWVLRDGIVDTARMASDVAANDGAEAVLGGTLGEAGGFEYLEL